jgi:hypothetical protein
MAEEKITPVLINSDDVNVLRVLLHTIPGSSPVATTTLKVSASDGE